MVTQKKVNGGALLVGCRKTDLVCRSPSWQYYMPWKRSDSQRPETLLPQLSPTLMNGFPNDS